MYAEEFEDFIPNESPEKIRQKEIGAYEGEPSLLKFHEIIGAVDNIITTSPTNWMRDMRLGWLSNNLGKGFAPSELLAFYERSKREEIELDARDIHEMLHEGDPFREWLIANLFPKGTTVLFYALGGTGKSLFLYDIIKHIATGKSWNGRPVTQANCLILQGDEPLSDTKQRLRIARYLDATTPKTIFYENRWTIDNTKYVKDQIKKKNIGFVMIDSLTSSNIADLSNENGAAYAAAIKPYTDMASDMNVTFVIVHHENKSTKSARGSSALENIVSEVIRLAKLEKEYKDGFGTEGLEFDEEESTSLYRVLEPRKTRNSYPENILLRLNTTNNSFSEIKVPKRDDSLRFKIFSHLESNPSKEFTDSDIASLFRISAYNAETELLGLSQNGWINAEEYFVKAIGGNDVRKYRFKYKINTHIERALDVKAKMLQCVTIDDVIDVMNKTTKEDRDLAKGFMTNAQKQQCLKMHEVYKQHISNQPSNVVNFPVTKQEITLTGTDSNPVVEKEDF